MEKEARKLTVRFAFLQSSYWMSQCAIYSFAAVFLKSKNFDNTQIGLVLSLAAVISIILQPIVSSFADKTKKITLRYIVITLMMVVMALALILYIMPGSFLLIAGVYVLINALQYTLNPLFNSLALEYINIGVPMNYGLARGIGSIAFAIMSYLLGILVDQFGPSVLLTIFIITYVFVIIAAFTFKIKVPADYSMESNFKDNDNTEATASSNINKNLDNAPSGIITFFIKYKKFALHLIGISTIFYSHNIINTYLINIIENVGGNSTDMGISLSVAAALELPTMAVFIYLVRKIKCSTLLKAAAFFFCLKAGLAWLAPNVITVHISMALQMLSFALYTPASVYYVNAIIDEKDKVKGQSMLGVATLGIAGTIANVTGGSILDKFGVSHMLLIGTIVTFIGFLIVLVSTENTEK